MQTTEKVIEIRAHGRPAPQGSKTPKGMRGGFTVMVESSKYLKPWRQAVQCDCREQYHGEILTGPIEISIIFYVSRPQAHYKIKDGILSNEIKPNRPTHSVSSADGDIDKLCRSVLDSLSAKCGGCVIQVDSLVVSITAEKRYVSNTEGPGALIKVVKL